MTRGSLSRADLIRCIDQMEPGRFLRVAENLGYREKSPAAADDQSRVVSATGNSLSSSEVLGIGSVGPLHRQYRLVERRSLAPLEQAPEPPRVPVEDEEPVPPLGPPPPLVPWPRLWPFLRAALGERAERGAVDVPALVASLSRGRPLRRLPRLRQRRWASQGQLILDLHHRLYPFWEDFNALKAALPRLRGAAGLEILRLDHGPAGSVRRWKDGRWDEPRPYVPPAPGTPVVVAGDLGCLGSQEDRQAWVRFGRRLAALDRVPVVLTPCPPRGWDPALAGLFFPVTLDRTARFPPGPSGPRPWPAEAASGGWLAADPGAETLLTLLSASIAIGPALLRHLRHALPVERADVGSEAAAWLHPALRAGEFALLPGDPDRVEPLRAAFRRQDADERRLAWNLIRAQQHGAAVAVRMEERALYAAMEGRTDGEVEAFLGRVAVALEQARTADGEQARFLTAWINRRGRRMHAAAWGHSPRSESLWLLANPQARETGATLPPGLNLHRALAALGVPEQPQAWILVQRGETFVIETPGAGSDQDHVSGSPVVEFMTRRPLLQARELRPGVPEISVPLVRENGLPVNDCGYRLITDSDELVIEPLARPGWAHTLGRDGRGLFAGFHDGRGERRAYWWNPGMQQGLGDDSRGLWHAEWKSGAFVDEPLFVAGGHGVMCIPRWADQAGTDAYGVYAAFRVGEVVQRVRCIWPGRFQMGSPEHEHGRDSDERQHEVVLTRGFWLAETACTQSLWQAVMGDNPSAFPGERRPVENVSWDDAHAFIARLNGRVPGLGARLPSEAEWEYACRAGTAGPFSFGEDISPEQVNYDGNHPHRGDMKGRYRGETVEVASLPANAWGLYEMHGNVWEWCADWYGAYPEGAAVDPTGPETGADRVLRGGSWLRGGGGARSACRGRGGPDDRRGDFGFRLALGPEFGPGEPAGQEMGSGAGQSAPGATGGSGQRGRSGPAARRRR